MHRSLSLWSLVRVGLVLVLSGSLFWLWRAFVRPSAAPAAPNYLVPLALLLGIVVVVVFTGALSLLGEKLRQSRIASSGHEEASASHKGM